MLIYDSLSGLQYILLVSYPVINTQLIISQCLAFYFIMIFHETMFESMQTLLAVGRFKSFFFFFVARRR